MASAGTLRLRAALCCVILTLAVAGCVVRETKPLPKISAIQAAHQIAQDELLDVAVHAFDPGVPAALVKDEQTLNKKRTNPAIRRAESRYVATMLRTTLETSAQWGAVRVVPDNGVFVDVPVSGKIIESTGANLALEVTVKDSTGRMWINNKRYATLADTGSYKTDAALRARDPFQNVYSEVANDMLSAREALALHSRRDIRRVMRLEFARDLAPQALDGYLDRCSRDRRECIRPAERSGLPSCRCGGRRAPKLTGTGEDQYREWRKLLQQMYAEDKGGTLGEVPAESVGSSEIQPVRAASGSLNEWAYPEPK